MLPEMLALRGMHAQIRMALYILHSFQPQEHAMIDEERMIEIEIKISRQEDLLDTLNQLVYQQQKKIDQLDALCSNLGRQLLDMQARNEAGGQSPVHEKPPHY
jgi:SlyX protein